MERYVPRVKLRMISPNRSSRGGLLPTLIVIHATISPNRPGLSDLEAIGSWFQNTSSQVSAHVCTDNEGNSARYVDGRDKAWHCMAYNGVSLGIEQVLPDTTGREITADLYKETARWVAYWSKIWHIPIQIAQVREGRVTRPGVCRHSGLGPLGGGHSDPGHYDMNGMLRLAKFYRSKI